ncbi:MAG: alpha/beta hydrolase [Myxococcaceae bacterium]|nr:alpha/beta hydrolase [Myxococcaceae bacterium]MCI0672998.1 alpha/beta hydrolase [Myxococcaceae bacterium]
MHGVWKRSSCLAAGVLAFFAALAAAPVAADPLPQGAESRTAKVDGLELHYNTMGRGDAVLLLHGYAETSRMWNPILPVLAKRFRVIAPDLPGIGDSAIPEGKVDMKSAATRIHALLGTLGIKRVKVVGHDIGLMVAYAYAAMYPKEVERLVVMDAFLPGVSGWEQVYDDPGAWHFRFHGDTPAKLVDGRERTYFEHYWNDFAANPKRSIPEADRKVYTEAYARPGRMRAGWAYFVSFPDTARDFAVLARTRLTMPVLSMGGEKSLGVVLGQQMKQVATDVKVVVLKDAGHWILEEQPEATTAALLEFLTASGGTR